KKGSGNKKKAKATPQSSNNSTYKIEGKRNYHTESSGKHNKKVNKEHKQDRQAKEKKQKQYQRNMEAPIEPSQRNNGKSTSNNHLEVQKTRKGVRNAEKVEPEIKFSNDARKQVSKDMKKFEPYVNVDPTNKYKAVNKHKNNPLEIRVPKDKDKYIQKDFSESKGYYIEVEKQKGRKVTRDAAKHKGVYVTVEKKPGRQVGRDAATYKGGYVVVEKNKGRKVSREAANYKGYVVIDRSRNRKIARQAANFEPNYVKVKQKLALTRMTYGKGHGKNAGKQVQKQRFAPHFKTIHNSTIKGKSNSMKKKPLKYTYDKGEVEIWN
ncbi:hypothetical protein, partial [Flammeovirga pacifica]|uniref:hypothetical protein n=1 Tax=Flammeovirga pacifica TaxID=915059 RepID=UPI0013010AC0